MSNETVTEKTEIVTKRGRPRKYPYPATLICSKSGKIVKTNPTQFQAQLNKSGLTQDEFIKNYICRSVRKQLKVVNNTNIS